MKYKSAPARLKAAEDGGDDGTFEAIVSVFDNKDHYGDIVRPGAFTDTIADWKASGDPVPVWWSHRMDDPEMNVGAVTELEELAAGDDRIPDWADAWVKEHGGLYVKGRIDTGDDASAKAKATRRMLRERRVTQFSYAYEVQDGGFVKEEPGEGADEDAAGEEYFELRKLKLYEVSPTPIGANELTELVGAKAALLAKAGRVLSAKNESTIREAVNLLNGVLAALDGDDDTEDGKAKAEEPPGAKAEEPRGMSVASIRLLSDCRQLELDAA